MWLGAFKWENYFWASSGTPLSYTNWNVGEPNNAFSGEYCLSMYQDQGYWNDLSCSNSDFPNVPQATMCEIPTTCRK
jgi:hypothetical protein